MARRMCVHKDRVVRSAEPVAPGAATPQSESGLSDRGAPRAGALAGSPRRSIRRGMAFRWRMPRRLACLLLYQTDAPTGAPPPEVAGKDDRGIA